MCHRFGFCYTGNHVNGLAHAATGYKRVLEENRKLYNLVQDLKGIYHHRKNKSLVSCLETSHLVIIREYTSVLSS